MNITLLLHTVDTGFISFEVDARKWTYDRIALVSFKSKKNEKVYDNIKNTFEAFDYKNADYDIVYVKGKQLKEKLEQLGYRMIKYDEELYKDGEFFKKESVEYLCDENMLFIIERFEKEFLDEICSI